MIFDPIAAGEKAKEIRKLRKAKHYKTRRSKLEPFRNEIALMFSQGYSLEVIQLHLETEHRCKVQRSTILRYIRSIGVTRIG